MSGDLAGPGAEMLRRGGAGRAMARREAVFALWQGGAALPATAPHRAARAGVRRGSALMADAPGAGAGRGATLTALRAAVASGPPVPRRAAVLPAAVLPAAVWQRGWTQAGAAAVWQARGAAGRLWTAPQGGAAAGPQDWAGRGVAPGGGAMAPGVAGALIATVIGLMVAIPAMFAYNFMVTKIRGITQELDAFSIRLSNQIEHLYGDNRALEDEIADAVVKAMKQYNEAEVVGQN